jgi:seryl-tRNA synthetase
MHDIRFIRENPESFDLGLKRRGLPPRSAELIALDEERRAATTAVQVAQSRRNEASKLIGAAMAKGDKEGAEAIKAEVAALKEQMPALEAKADELAAKLKCHQSLVARIESGQRRIDVVELVVLARAMGFDPSEMLALVQAATEPDHRI